MEAMTDRSAATALVENAKPAREPAIPAAIDDLDRAIADLHEALEFTSDRADRLIVRVDAVLNPKSAPGEIAAEMNAGLDQEEAPIASSIHSRAARVRTLALRVRDVGRTLDAAGDRVEL